MTPFPVNPRPCSQCGALFAPMSSTARACSPICAILLGKVKKAAAKVALKVRKEAIKTLPTLKYEAQAAFNAFIRARDAGRPCICCGMPLSAGDVGGAFDCGHYRSVGSAPHLRYDERNAHGQRKQCNRWGAGRAVDYRIGLIARIGLESVEALEAEQSVRKWGHDELRSIKADYTARTKQLKREAA